MIDVCKNQSDLEQYISEFKTILAPYLQESGKVIYSAANTLCKGDIYFLGLNPGGTDHPDERKEWIGNSLELLPQQTHNEYLDDPWRGMAPGTSPLQRRIQDLFHHLEYDLRSVCASNLIFIRSESIDKLPNYKELVDGCWPVHEMLITKIVKPKVILSFGNAAKSAIAYIAKLHRQQFKKKPVIQTFLSGHGQYKCKYFETSIKEHPVKVIGVPHMSRFILKDYAMMRIKELINS